MSDIKKFFTSRFGDAGYIVEVDYSQLEIVALAELSQDQNLIKDIQTGVDMHRRNAADLFNKPQVEITKEERRIAKEMSFILQYGGSANSMNNQLGVDKQLAKKFIDQYYSRYYRVREWQDQMLRHVYTSRQPEHGLKTKNGLPAAVSVIKSWTGRQYRFTEYDAPDWSADITNFSPTEVKNYPVQGFATGDIVPIMLGYLRRAIYAQGWQDKVLLVNTVHDSIILDIQEEMLYNITEMLKNVLESVPQILKTHFDIDTVMSYPCEVSYGRNWHDQIEYSFS